MSAAKETVAKLTKSEEELGAKWDKCLQDMLIKLGSGVGLGIVFSVVLFKRRPWPVIFGSGTGFGMAYANCQHEFQSPFFNLSRNSVIKVSDPKLVDEILKSQVSLNWPILSQNFHNFYWI